MAETMECLGFSLPDGDIGALLDELIPSSEMVGHAEAAGITSWRWEDPSGVRVMVGMAAAPRLRLRRSVDVEPVSFVPSLAAPVGVTLTAPVHSGDTMVAFDVLVDGEVATRLLLDLEQADHVPAPGVDDIAATLLALGVEMTIHADADAFDASQQSALGEEESMRFAAESIVSYGLFDGEEDGRTYAFLAGTVLESETRTNAHTGRPFHVVQVGLLGFVATVCLSADEHPVCPQPGNVVAGTSYLIASDDTLWEAQPEGTHRRRSWRGRVGR